MKGLLWTKKDYNPADVVPLAVIILTQDGLRCDEVLGLKWSDLQSPYLHLTGQYKKQSVLDEKGNWKDIFVFVPYTKANRTARLPQDQNIPITKIAAQVFDYIAQHRTSSEFIFSRKDGMPTPRAVSTRLEKLCRQLDIPFRSPHKLRYTYASMLGESGLSDEEIQRLLGHHDINTTRIYRLNRTKKLETANKVIQIFETIHPDTPMIFENKKAANP